MDEPLIGTSEAAKILKTRPSYVLRLAYLGKLRVAATVPTGSRFVRLFRPSDVEAYALGKESRLREKAARLRAGIGRKHGHTSGVWRGGRISPEYCSWKNMKQRCLDPGAKQWKDYGGRGIRVCERWLIFENFLADMGPRPPGLTLDRIDNELGYFPGNCRWATRKEQQSNSRRAERVNQRKAA